MRPACAIGVTTKNLCGPAYSLVGRVNHNSRAHTAIVKRGALKTVESFAEGLEFGLVNWDDLFSGGVESALTQLTLFVKSPEFAAEKGVRLRTLPSKSEIPQLRVLPRKTMISQHLPIRFEASGEKHLLPIARVKIPVSRSDRQLIYCASSWAIGSSQLVDFFGTRMVENLPQHHVIHLAPNRRQLINQCRCPTFHSLHANKSPR